MSDTNIEKLIIERKRALSRDRKKIRDLTSERTIDFILDHPQPAALVQSFPEEEFYFLVHDIGVHDIQEIMSFASFRQWEFILDVEIWNHDRPEMALTTKWLDLFLQADPDRFIYWFLNHQTNFLEYYMYRNMAVYLREHDQDPSVFGDDCFTMDDVFYIRFVDPPHDPNGKYKGVRDAFLSRFLDKLAQFDYFTYQKVLLEAQTIIPAEAEEEAYRMRNIRLAEKGFMPREEAIGVYQPLKTEDISGEGVKRLVGIGGEGGESTRVSLMPVEYLSGDNVFSRALSSISPEEILYELQSEFAGLCNQIIAADNRRVRSREDLSKIVAKACGYLTIGLMKLTGEKDVPLSRFASLIRTYPLARIFRVGYGSVLDLKWRAEKWKKESWFQGKNLPLSFWGEEWLGRIGGLLIEKPQYFDNFKTGVLYREFASMDEIRSTEDTLCEAVAVDKILSHLDPHIDPFQYREELNQGILNWKSLLLTLWVRQETGLGNDIEPVPLKIFREFYGKIWSDPEENRKSTGLPAKESFLDWISNTSGLDRYDISQAVGKTLENLFKEIESEYGSVDTKFIDPRFVSLFLVE